MTLLRDLSREQAEDAARVLDRSGVVGRAVAGDMADSRWRIDVDADSVAAGVAALKADRIQARCSDTEVPSATNRWIETPGEERARHASQLSTQLERSLTRLPGVIEARVHVTLPFGMRSLPEVQTPAAASALVVREAGSASAALAARELIAGAIPTLPPSAVRVVESIVPPMTVPQPQFARFGPVVVTRASANSLKLGIAASLLLNILLAAAVLRPLVKRRHSRQKPGTTSMPSEPRAPESNGE